jgi:hypothetical protein
MLAVIYLACAWLTGYRLLKRLTPQLFKSNPYTVTSETQVSLPSWLVTIPAAFLVGTLLATWLTYIVAYLSAATGAPLFIGNLVALAVFGFAAAGLVVSVRQIQPDLFRQWRSRAALLIESHKFEMIFLLIVLAIAFFLMFDTLRIEDGTLLVGSAVFSDFGPHLAVIRSFSYGSNFPTEYPHFADGKARYHFLFQFLAGNLEFLGLPLDWAFNLPSILAFTSFIMLLYSLAFILFGNRWVGVLGFGLFFFRSSMAFFTFIRDLGGFHWAQILGNAKFIGKTQNEYWGLWATPDVFTNQRHFPFALGLMILIVLLVLPLYRKMIGALAEIRQRPGRTRGWIREFLLREDAWAPLNLQRSIVAGILLGLIGFWNGAVLLATLTILLGMGLASKHRLEYLNIAVIALILSALQTMLFIGGSAVQPKITIGFLAARPDFPSIIAYYGELLGLLPLVIVASLAVAPRGSRWLAFSFTLPLVMANTLQLTPDIAVNHKYVAISVILLNLFAAYFLYYLFTLPWQRREIRGDYCLALEAAPALESGLSDTHHPSPDICYPVTGWVTVKSVDDRKVVADLSLRVDWDYMNAPNTTVDRIRTGLICYRNRPEVSAFRRRFVHWTVVGFSVLLLIVLTITGWIDALTFWNANLPGRSVTYRMDDPVLQWVRQHTGPNEIFLTDTYCIHPILLAGRKIFYGWPYFAWSAGYDTDSRKMVAAGIYSAVSPESAREMARKNHISYIVIEDGNRNSNEYRLNEAIFKDHFQLVYANPASRIAIYRTY